MIEIRKYSIGYFLLAAIFWQLIGLWAGLLTIETVSMILMVSVFSSMIMFLLYMTSPKIPVYIWISGLVALIVIFFMNIQIVDVVHVDKFLNMSLITVFYWLIFTIVNTKIE